LSYNVLLTTPKPNVVLQPIISIVIVKSTLTCTNYTKTGHSVETCHNKKIKVLVVLIAIVKSIEPIARTKTQPIKLGKIPICYPCIIYSSIKHRFGECPKNFMYRTCSKLNLLVLMP